MINSQGPVRDLMAMLIGKLKLTDDGKRKVGQLKDLLDRMLMLEPGKRISVMDSLQHTFITEKIT